MTPANLGRSQLLWVMSSNAKSSDALESVNVKTTEPPLYAPVLIAVPAVSAAAEVA